MKKLVIERWIRANEPQGGGNSGPGGSGGGRRVVGRACAEELWQEVTGCNQGTKAKLGPEPGTGGGELGGWAREVSRANPT